MPNNAVARAQARHVVCVTHYFPSQKGGIETVAFEINRRLANTGHVVEWFASAPLAPSETILGLNYRPVEAIHLVERLLGIPLPIWISKGVLQLSSTIRECDVVHIHDFIYPGSMLAFALARLWNKKVILTQHIGHIPYTSRALLHLLTLMNRCIGRVMLRSASRVVFISNAVQHYFNSFVRFRNPTLYLPNGVDFSVFHPVSENQRRQIRCRLGFSEDQSICLFVGRFVEKKGMSILAQLVSRSSRIQWLFAGQGPMHPREWKAENIRIFERCNHRELADLYRAADLLVLPSRGEGFPLVVQEAFACGTPALVSDETAAGCEEARPLLIELPVTGSQAVDKWWEKLLFLCSSDSSFAARRLAVSEFARKAWNWDRVVEAYDQLYSEGPIEAPDRTATVPSASGRMP